MTAGVAGAHEVMGIVVPTADDGRNGALVWVVPEDRRWEFEIGRHGNITVGTTILWDGSEIDEDNVGEKIAMLVGGVLGIIVIVCGGVWMLTYEKEDDTLTGESGASSGNFFKSGNGFNENFPESESVVPIPENTAPRLSRSRDPRANVAARREGVLMPDAIISPTVAKRSSSGQSPNITLGGRGPGEPYEMLPHGDGRVRITVRLGEPTQYDVCEGNGVDILMPTNPKK